jgi:hypothetical protein
MEGVAAHVWPAPHGADDEPDSNGARLRRHKLHDSTPEHVGFAVTERPLMSPAMYREIIQPGHQRLFIAPRWRYQRASGRG